MIISLYIKIFNISKERKDQYVLHDIYFIIYLCKQLINIFLYLYEFI